MQENSDIDDLAVQICAAARGWIGTPYHHRQSARGLGCDCLGLLIGVFQEVTGNAAPALPSYGPSWTDGGDETLLKGLARYTYPTKTLAAGTIIAFRYRRTLPARHVAIATSATHMIHAYDKRAVSEVLIGRDWLSQIAMLFTLSPPAP